MSGPAGAMLELHGLRKAFGALTVTDIDRFAVASGEIHALIGPNGAGKSSLINQITGAWQPDRGRILLDGRDVTALPVHRRARHGIGRVFQVSTLCRSLTALEHVALAVQCRQGHGLAAQLRRSASDRSVATAAAAVIEQVGLQGRAELPAGELAHGDKRFLELAMALALRPRLLLLDEPMAGMSREDTTRMTALLIQLKPVTGMLLVEHDMDAVFAVADRVSVLVNGAILASGPPAAIRASAVVRDVYLGDETGLDDAAGSGGEHG